MDLYPDFQPVVTVSLESVENFIGKCTTETILN